MHIMVLIHLEFVVLRNCMKHVFIRFSNLIAIECTVFFEMIGVNL